MNLAIHLFGRHLGFWANSSSASDRGLFTMGANIMRYIRYHMATLPFAFVEIVRSNWQLIGNFKPNITIVHLFRYVPTAFTYRLIETELLHSV